MRYGAPMPNWTDAADDDGHRPLAEVWGDFDVRSAALDVCHGRLGLGGIAWSRLCHGYGTAEDFPSLIDTILGADTAAATAALDDVRSYGFVEGIVTAPGALVTPFLLRAVADPAVRHRHELLHYAASTARREVWWHENRADLLRVTYPEVRYDVSGYVVDWSIEAARRSIGVHLTPLTALLDDPDPRVRANAAYALAAGAPASARITHALQVRLPAEPAPAVRISLVLAAAQHSRELGAAGPALDSARTLWMDPARDDAVRLAGAVAWLCLTGAAPPAALTATVTALVTPAMFGVLHEVPWLAHLEARHLPVWLTALLDDQAEGLTPQTYCTDPWADLSADVR